MKSILAAPIIPISFQMSSHRAAQGVIYADILRHTVDKNLKVSMSRPNSQGPDAVEASKTEDFNQYDNLYMYHGNDRSEDSQDINLFGGTKFFSAAYNVRNISRFKGQVYSIGYDMPDYATMLQNKFDGHKRREGTLDNMVPEFLEVDIENFRKMREKAITIKPWGPWDKLVAGDSHAICMYRPGWNVNSVPFKTLHGALKLGLRSFIQEDTRHGEFYFGNIDIRHHVCRYDYREAIDNLVNEYVKQVKELNLESSAIYELLPIENIRRRIPKSGWFEGTGYYGSWEERNEARLYFKKVASKVCKKAGVEFKEWITPEFYNEAGEMDFKVMEKPKSVHLSREYYPHWQGFEYNNIKKNTLEGLFE